MADFVMPVLGADMEDGTLVAWLKHEGDHVSRGDIVAEVETQKGLIEVEIFATGVLEKILVTPGTTVPVGTVLAIVREEPAAEPAPSPPAAAPPPKAAPIPMAASAPTPPLAPVATADAPAARRVSPAARVLARELHVDLATVTSSGPHGVIQRADVERAAAATGAPRPAAPVTEKGQRGMRQAIGAAMARSKREIPHYYLATTIDLQAATAWLTEQNASRPVTERLVIAPLLIKAVALALKEVPELNGRWQDDHAVPSAAIHVGVGIALRDGGLVAPGLHDVDRESIASLMERLRDLVNRARAGRLRSSELSDPTITVTSLGDQGVETVFGVIFPPQLAIVGFGRVVERPWVVDGAVVARPVVDATLAADHRASDGHRGARFLSAVARLLQHPEAL